MLLFRTSKVVNISAAANNVNLFTQAGSPPDAQNIIINITAPIRSANTTAALTTGSFKGGSLLYINNSNTITGFTGTTGANGAGGTGGTGGASAGSAPAGSVGGTGVTGGTGNPALIATTVTGLKTVINNLGSIIGGVGGTGGAGGGGGGGGGGSGYSDYRLKTDITLLETLFGGINLYSFKYTFDASKVWVGVMAQEIEEIFPKAVSKDECGYRMVNYNMLDLKMQTLEEYKARKYAHD